MNGKHQRSHSCQLHPITSHYLNYVSWGRHLITALLSKMLGCFFFFFACTSRLFSRSLLRHFFILQTFGTQGETIYRTPPKHQAELLSPTPAVCCSQTHGIRARVQHPTWIPKGFHSLDFVPATLSLKAGICISQRLWLQVRMCERGIGTQKRTTPTASGSTEGTTSCVGQRRRRVPGEGRRTLCRRPRSSASCFLFTSDNGVLVCN